MSLQNTETFDAETMMFSKPKEVPNVPGSFRIRISVSTPKGEEPLLFLTESLFSFGVQVQTDPADKTRITGYTIPLCLHDTDSPTEEQEMFVDCLNSISDRAKQHMLTSETKKALKRFIQESDLKKLNPIYQKIDPDTGAPVADKGPMLYAKLLTNKALKIYSEFADPAGRRLDPLSLMGEMFRVRAVIKIESIFVGSNYSLQLKAMEVEVQPKQARVNLLLRAPAPASENEESVDIQDFIQGTPSGNKPTEDGKSSSSEPEEDDDVPQFVSAPSEVLPAKVVAKPKKRVLPKFV